MNKLLPTQTKTPSNHKTNSQIYRTLSILRSESFQGPLPHPDFLLKYEQAQIGAAGRIIKMAENQSKHRQKMESTVITANVQNERTGMHYSFILTGMFMVTGTILIVLDKQTAGYFSLFGPSIFHAGNYVYKKYAEKAGSKKKEEELKNAEKRKKKRKLGEIEK